MTQAATRQRNDVGIQSGRWSIVGICLLVGVSASIVSILAYTPRFYMWPAVGNYVVHRAPEYSRANALLMQIQDPWNRKYDPLHEVLAWRMFFPLLWHYGHLPPRWILGAPHLGCVVTLWLVAWLTYQRLRLWVPTVLATLLFATLPWFFVSSGWLGYFDSWYVLGLLVAAFLPSRWTLAMSCLLTPWIDERFLLALPLTLVLRQGAFVATQERAWRDWAYDVALAIVCTLPYLGIRAIAWLQGDADAQLYVQSHLHTLPDVPTWRFFAGLWSAYRAGWLVIVLGLWVWTLRAGWKAGLALTAVVVVTAVCGLLIANDMSRSEMMTCAALVFSIWLWESRRPRSFAWLLPIVVAANFLLPATHELWSLQFTISRFPTEWARLMAPTPSGLVAANLIVEAESLLAQGRQAEALAALDQAIALDKSYAVAFAQRAALKVSRNDMQGAESDADQALRRNPTMPYAYYIRGLARMALEKPEAARADARLALEYGGPNWGMRGRAVSLLQAIGRNPPSSNNATPDPVRP
jgi:hypothetical protein